MPTFYLIVCGAADNDAESFLYSTTDVIRLDGVIFTGYLQYQHTPGAASTEVGKKYREM